MQTQSVNWVEVVKALGPYVTAIIAIIASALTAWVGHRYWLKQFVTEKAFAIRQDRIRLLQEIPQKIMKAIMLSQSALIWRALWEVSSNLIQEREGLPEAAFEAEQQFLQRHREATEQLHEMLSELYVMRISSRIYFGKKTGQAVEASLKSMQQFIEPGQAYTEIRNAIYEHFSNALDSGVQIDQLIPNLISEARQNMIPLILTTQESIASTIRSMMEDMVAQ